MSDKSKTEEHAGPAEKVVDALVQAFNAKDLDGFLSCFTESAEVWELGENRPMIRGKKTLRSVYSRIFEKKPEQRVDVVTRIAHEGTVTQKERTQEKENLVIYKTTGNRVTKIWL